LKKKGEKTTQRAVSPSARAGKKQTMGEKGGKRRRTKGGAQ